VAALIVPSSIAAADKRPPQPNVVLLLADDLGHGAVMSQVDDLSARGLQDTTHHVDRRVMAIKEAGGGDKPHMMLEGDGG